jgi:hypothetical protein
MIELPGFTLALTLRTSRRDWMARASLILAAALAVGLDAPETAAKKRRRKRKRKQHRHQQPDLSQQPDLPLDPADPTPRERADAACPGGTGNASSANGNARYAQTFTAQASGPLVRAELRIGKAQNTAGDYILRLSTVNGSGTPTNTVVASALKPDGDVPVGVGIVSFTFPTPYSLVAGVRYALVITRPGSTVLQVNGHQDDACAGDAYFSNDQNDPFASFSMADLIFAAYVMS